MDVLVASWLGSTNLGDELIFRALADRLRARSVGVTGISLDPGASRRQHPGIRAVHHLDLPRLTVAAASADVVLFGGGGLLQDETGPLNLPYHLSRVALARAVRTPLALAGLGVGPLRRTGRALVGRAFPAGTPATARDAASQILLERTTRCRVRLAADLAFGLEVPESRPADDRLGVALRPPVVRSAMGAAVAQRRAGDDDTRLRAVARSLDAVVDTTGLTPHFIAMQRDRDGAHHRAVADRMRAPATFATPTVDTVMAELSSVRAVVGMRYHAGVCAVLAGRPCVLLAYSGKVESLRRDAAPAALAPSDKPWSGLPGVVRHALRVPDERVADVRARLRDREAINGRLLDDVLEGAGGP